MRYRHVMILALPFFWLIAGGLYGCKKDHHGHPHPARGKADHTKKHLHQKKHTSTRPHARHRSKAHDHKHHDMQHDFSDVKRWIKIFNNPKRKAWQKPEEVVKHMQLKKGMHVADIGAGTGYFLGYLRQAVGAKGQVWGLDLAQPLVKYMNQQAKKAGWKNVQAKKVKGDAPGLQAKSVDRILIVNTWHHIPKRVSYAKKLKASLKRKGALFIVDFTKTSKRGPAKKHKLTSQEVMAELKQAGFKTKTITETLPDQYIVKATP